MSKHELREAAFETSGVTYEESLIATNKLEPVLFERIGREEGCYKLSELFYNRVFQDKEANWFLNIFSSSTRAEAIDNQFRFFVQTFGGPELYKEKKGKYTRLVGRHAAFHIGTKAAERWIHHMALAMKEHPALANDEEARQALIKYFTYTAHYIVAASEYMKPDQLSGGTQMDYARNW